MAQKRYAALQSLGKTDNFYDYEKEFDKVWQQLGREVLEASISELPANKDTESEAAISLINYYTGNAYRMDYKTYKTIGAGIIGSGTIESAHRTVVQKRMKQSGQRWSNAGAQNMLNLRVLQMNRQCDKVVMIIKNAA